MARVLVIASLTRSLVVFRGDLLREMQARGHEPICCSPTPDPASLEQLQAWGIPHHTCRMARTGQNPAADLRTYFDLAGIMSRTAPDQVLSYTIKPVIYGSLAARRRRVSRVTALITGLGTAFEYTDWRGAVRNRLARGLYKAALRGCDHVFFQNPDDRHLFVDQKLVRADQCQLINGSGVPLDRFPASPVPTGPMRFLLIARLLKDKGVCEFAEAARVVRQSFPEATFHITGFFEDHPRGVSAEQVRAWEADGILHFDGPTSDVRPALEACTVYCLPSYREGLPRTVLEAMATGRPIITTDAPGCRETVVEGVNGHLVPVRDPGALARAMLDCCRHPEKLPEYGRQSRQLAEEKFSVTQVNADILATMGL